MRTTTTVLLICLTTVMSWQDPKPAKAQDPKKPEATSKPAKVPGRPKRHRYEGVYKLKRRVMDGIPDDKPSRGYLAITGRHLFLNLASSGPEKDHPLVHAGVREWRPAQDGLRTTARLDFFSDSAGDLHFVEDGKQEVRRIQEMRGGLRVLQGQRSWLEFERVE